MNARRIAAAWSLLATLLVAAPPASAETVIVRAGRLLDVETLRKVAGVVKEGRLITGGNP